MIFGGKMNNLDAISVVDGRYASKTDELRDIFSEYGLIRHRVFVEVEWLKFILGRLGFDDAPQGVIDAIDAIYSGFNTESGLMVKKFESVTNHDVKSVEYYLKDQLENRGLGHLKEWVHFCCTSEDINNTSYALMIKKGKDIVGKLLGELLEKIESLAKSNKAVPMMARTHGQPATPTTVGKEFINFAARFRRELEILDKIEVECKFSGATGNWNAHVAAKPDVDWLSAAEEFISEIFHTLIRISSTLIDMDRDIWTYISLAYFKQKPKEGEVGSSTMPHKINPIDFENSEGNAGVAISLMEHLSTKLLNSRMQRDLTDSTVLRNVGLVFGYILISIKNCMKGLSKIEVNYPKLAEDLENNLELLAEPVQTVMRVYGEENPYEKLKGLTRGKRIERKDLDEFIDSLEKVPADVKEKLKKLEPSTYLGIAEKLVDEYFARYGK